MNIAKKVKKYFSSISSILSFQKIQTKSGSAQRSAFSLYTHSKFRLKPVSLSEEFC